MTVLYCMLTLSVILTPHVMMTPHHVMLTPNVMLNLIQHLLPPNCQSAHRYSVQAAPTGLLFTP